MTTLAWPSTDDRPRRAYSRESLARVERVLVEAAAAGARCPTNRELAATLGITEEAAKTSIRRLARADRIRIVASTGAGRTIEIPATGTRTAATGPGLALVPAPPGPSPRTLPVRRAAAPAEPPPARTGAPPRGRAAPGVRFACERLDRVPAHQQRTGCGWIEGDLPSGEWSYCNRSVEPGTAWCRHHYRRCYVPREVP